MKTYSIRLHKIKFELILVNNNSTDKSVEIPVVNPTIFFRREVYENTVIHFTELPNPGEIFIVPMVTKTGARKLI